MAEDFSHGARGLRRRQMKARSAARGYQDARGGFKARSLNRAGIGQFRKNTLKPLGDSIIGNGHDDPLHKTVGAALPGARDA
jgi:hypothetical protein